MYVSAANDLYALDAGSGRQIWNYRRPRTRGLAGVAARGVNRGVAVGGDRVFMATDHAHLIALNRATGALLWETRDGRLAPELQRHRRADGRRQPGRSRASRAATRARAGSSRPTTRRPARRCGGSGRCRRAASPARRRGRAARSIIPGAATWMTGSYDAELGTLYWAIGNPGPDMIGDERQGDNLYSDSVVALDVEDRPPQVALPVHAARRARLRRAAADRARRRAVEGPAAQAAAAGQSQRLLLRARSRHRRVPARHAVREEHHVGVGSDAGGTADRRAEHGADAAKGGACARRSRARRTGTRRRSARAPGSSTCRPTTSAASSRASIRRGRRARASWAARSPRRPNPRSACCAPSTSRPARWRGSCRSSATWTRGAACSATAGDVVFFCDDSGAFAAADAKTGKRLWSFQTSQVWKSSPMTYVFDNRQMLAVASGPSILAFGLPKP